MPRGRLDLREHSRYSRLRSGAAQRGDPMANPYGDTELDARGMRALAHPVRVKVLSELQRHGPSTATLLSPAVGASPSVTSWHLRHLAQHGLVRDAPGRGSGRERWWEAASRGFRLRADG